MNRVDAWRMIQRRAAELGTRARIGCHTFRATGITAYLEAGGTLENAQAMAAHESPRTTKLYDRTGDEITLDEVERITIRDVAWLGEGGYAKGVQDASREGGRIPPVLAVDHFNRALQEDADFFKTIRIWKRAHISATGWGVSLGRRHASQMASVDSLCAAVALASAGFAARAAALPEVPAIQCVRPAHRRREKGAGLPRPPRSRGAHRG